MINSASQYDFVTNLSGIVIDGGIMPARDAAHNPTGIMQPKCLRGEDIAFLAECAGERNTVMSNQLQATTAFSNQVSLQQLGDVQQSLTSHIITPQNATQGFYVIDGYEFEDVRRSVTLNQIDLYDPSQSQNRVLLNYPDCCMSSIVSHQPAQKILRADDIRDMFRDAKNTREMIPNNNAVVFPGAPNYGYPYPPQENITEVQSSFQQHLAQSNWNSQITADYANFSNSLVLYGYGGSGWQAPGQYNPARYYKYYYTLQSFNMKVQIPRVILPYVETDVTAIVQVYSQITTTWLNSSHTDYEYDYQYRLSSFPLKKTRSMGGVVTINYSDMSGIVDKLNAAFTQEGFYEWGWYEGKYVSRRGEVVFGVPIVLKLTNHTDFSSISWS